eukprot:TRINITY_DN66093_c0_g1_i1.p1 TRINITY_DN66093_c0_g1~~TRINITY_DN66093_c0_g1_i1.p1  ORF type:complete len:617 (-),score=107.09 TRINITY_DN66093_c0_g1_i1:96-1904(-)
MPRPLGGLSYVEDGGNVVHVVPSALLRQLEALLDEKLNRTILDLSSRFQLSLRHEFDARDKLQKASAALSGFENPNMGASDYATHWLEAPKDIGDHALPSSPARDDAHARASNGDPAGGEQDHKIKSIIGGGAVPLAASQVEAREAALNLLPSQLKDMVRKEEAQKISVHKQASFERMNAAKNLPLMKKLVRSVLFEAICAMAIIVNSVLLGVEVQYAARHLEEEIVPFPFLLFRLIFSFVFLFELLLRAGAEGWSFCDQQDRKWNIFDAALVGCSIPEMIADILVLSGADTTDSMNFNLFRIFRMVKVLRLIRAIRSPLVTRYVRPLQIMVVSIIYSLKALAWILVLLLVIMYLFSVVIVQAKVDFVRDVGVDEANEDVLLTVYWYDLPESIMTLFKAATGGVSWHDAVKPLNAVAPWLVYFFACYIFFTLLCVFNVVTGVFCSAAIEAASHDPELQAHYISQNQLQLSQHITEFFKKMDADGSGTVTVKELEAALKRDEMIAYFEAIGMGVGEAWELFKLLDKDGSNTVDMEEFVDGCIKLKGGSTSVDIAFVRKDLRRISALLEADLATRTNLFDAYSPMLEGAAEGLSTTSATDASTR